MAQTPPREWVHILSIEKCPDATIVIRVPAAWGQLAEEFGSAESGRTHQAQLAPERILGTEEITAAVATVLGFQPGWHLAASVLSHVRSLQDAELAYQTYTTSTGNRASMAVWLIKEICHRAALTWLPAFLADPNVAGAALDVLDQLIFAHAVDPEDERVQAILTLADRHPSPVVQEKATATRSLITVWLAEMAAPDRS